MAWYNSTGMENDVVVSSRIRFARNIADYPFDSKLDTTSCTEIIEKVEKALGDNYKKVDFKAITLIEAHTFMEKHYVSPDFVKKNNPHALFTDDSSDLSVMVCEEDHIRLQCIMPGLSLDEAYANAVKCDEKLDENLNIAFDEDLGYLTHCPTNLGLAMRASVMLFLPALTMHRSINSLAIQLSKLGLTIRGMYGEGTDPDGCLYQISNRVNMGITEEDTIKKLSEIVKQICEKERSARKSLLSDNYMAISDRICRSYGVMKYARIMSSREFMKLYSDVRLGISFGIIESLTYEKLGDIMIGIMPANLALQNGEKVLSESERDIKRAEYIRCNIE